MLEKSQWLRTQMCASSNQPTNQPTIWVDSPTINGTKGPSPQLWPILAYKLQTMNPMHEFLSLAPLVLRPSVLKVVKRSTKMLKVSCLDDSLSTYSKFKPLPVLNGLMMRVEAMHSIKLLFFQWNPEHSARVFLELNCAWRPTSN